MAQTNETLFSRQMRALEKAAQTSSVKYSTIDDMKSAITTKVKRQLEVNSDYEVDENLLGDFIDDAVSEIKDWRKLNNDNEFLNGMYDSKISRFVIESYNILGIEGQSYESNGATAKQFTETPLSRLKSSIPQKI